MNNKIFCGNGKAFGQYGTIGMSICLDDLPDEFITTGRNGKRYIKINLNSNKDGVDKFDNTHYLTVDTWKKDNASAPVKSAPMQYGDPIPEEPGFTRPPAPSDDLPF